MGTTLPCANHINAINGNANLSSFVGVLTILTCVLGESSVVHGTTILYLFSRALHFVLGGGGY